MHGYLAQENHKVQALALLGCCLHAKLFVGEKMPTWKAKNNPPVATRPTKINPEDWEWDRGHKCAFS